ncbi:MAG: tail fiber domain-containing protein, partial [archaeon]|nr:tail fiber domain-containing protein [archaeon]
VFGHTKGEIDNFCGEVGACGSSSGSGGTADNLNIGTTGCKAYVDSNYYIKYDCGYTAGTVKANADYATTAGSAGSVGGYTFNQNLRTSDTPNFISQELRWNGGTPYIDFSNDATSDNDARIILGSNGLLQIESANIQVGGNLFPSSDSGGLSTGYYLGTSSKRWRKVYSASGTIDTSDISYKKNINSLNYGIDEIMKMKPVSYYWKNDSTNEGKQIGFIAQDMIKVVPEVVDGEEGNYGLNYAHLIPVLTKAIQEQQLQINELKARIAELEAGN